MKKISKFILAATLFTGMLIPNLANANQDEGATVRCTRHRHPITWEVETSFGTFMLTVDFVYTTCDNPDANTFWIE